MTKQLKNFVMMGTDADGNEYVITMNDLETAMYIDSGFGEFFDMAVEVFEVACERNNIEFDDMPDVITEEEAA